MSYLFSVFYLKTASQLPVFLINSDDLGLLLVVMHYYSELYKRLLEEKSADLNFSFKVLFARNESAQHLKKVEFIDKSTNASISFRPKVGFKFLDTNEWEIKLKLFEDENINDLFKDFAQRLQYIFFYYPVEFENIVQEIAVELIKFINEEVEKNEKWNLLLLSEKKEIIIDVLIQLLKFCKYFNMVIRIIFLFTDSAAHGENQSINILLKMIDCRS